MREQFNIPDWQPVVRLALTALGKDGHIDRVMAGEYVVHQRLYEIAGAPGYDKERVALQDATNTLRALKYPARSQNLG